MDYYELLGVNRNASQEAIKHAFHSRIRITHPDVNQGSALAEQETRRLIEAYRTLSDPRARQRYDLFTTPVRSDAPAVVPVRQVMRYSSPSPSINRGWLFIALIAVIISIAVYVNHQNNQLVFRPFLVNGELPSAAPAPPCHLLVEPSPTENMEWYHTQQYIMSMADPWATEQMVLVYKRAAERAQQRGDTSRADFYKSAVENVSRLYL